MLLCANCGVYVAALISHKGRDYATLNANVLDARELCLIMGDGT